jgi:hypothetical protein
MHSIAATLQPLMKGTDRDYQAWRRTFMRSRLNLGLGIAILCTLTIALIDLLQIVLNPAQAVAKFVVSPNSIILCNSLILLSLAGCWIIHQTRIGQRHPEWIFLGMSWSVTFPVQFMATINGFAYPDIVTWSLIFIAQATIVPVYWQLHLGSQASVLGYYLIVNSILGLVPDDTSNYVLMMIGGWTLWLCLICDVAVYLYEKLKRAELKSRQELQQFLQIISHDLRQSVAAIASVFQTLSHPSKDRVMIDRHVLERLHAESDRNLALIQTLLDTHHAD